MDENQIRLAVWKSDINTHHAMVKLLTANDVQRDPAMRTNILEIMNKLQRDNRALFEFAGVDIDDASDRDGEL